MARWIWSFVVFWSCPDGASTSAKGKRLKQILWLVNCEDLHNHSDSAVTATFSRLAHRPHSIILYLNCIDFRSYLVLFRSDSVDATIFRISWNLVYPDLETNPNFPIFIVLSTKGGASQIRAYISRMVQWLGFGLGERKVPGSNPDHYPCYWWRWALHT